MISKADGKLRSIAVGSSVMGLQGPCGPSILVSILGFIHELPHGRPRFYFALFFRNGFDEKKRYLYIDWMRHLVAYDHYVQSESSLSIIRGEHGPV